MGKNQKQDGSTIWDILDNPTVFDGERRELIRPVIHKKTVVISVVVRLTITGLISFVLSQCIFLVFQDKHLMPLGKKEIFWLCTLICYILLLLMSLKRIFIFFVMLYQAKASDEIRLRCVFAPSCSEYMILSLKKYGATIGLIKGIGRLHRCKHSNGIGGEDYP